LATWSCVSARDVMMSLAMGRGVADVVIDGNISDTRRNQVNLAFMR
jgi:regulator of RNase E activity RraA